MNFSGVLSRAILVLSCISSSLAFARAPEAFSIGIAKIDITPKDLKGLNPVGGPGPYGGGGDFVGYHDPLFARALILDTGADKVAFVAVDEVEVFDTLSLRQRVQREVGIAPDHIMIFASHSHSAPRLRNGDPPYPGAVGLGVTALVGPPSPPIPEMDANLKIVDDKILDALRVAANAMQPARMGYGTGSADLNGPTGDKTVPVFKFETLNGQPIAFLFNYAVHSTVTLNTWMVSGDLAGAAAKVIEQHYDGKVVALYSMGAAGDQDPKYSGDNLSTGPRPKRSDPSGRDGIARNVFPAMDAQGFILGAEVLQVAKRIRANLTNLRIAAAESQITCPTKSDQPRWQEFKGGATIHFSVILLNDIAIIGIAAEVVTNIWRHMKADSPLRDIVMLTATNGHLGYLVDDAEYSRKDLHANDSSPILKGCAEQGVVDGTVKLIRQLSTR